MATFFKASPPLLKQAFIKCDKLTLVKSIGEEPPHFAIVRSWVIGDSKIEVIRRPSKSTF